MLPGLALRALLVLVTWGLAAGLSAADGSLKLEAKAELDDRDQVTVTIINAGTVPVAFNAGSFELTPCNFSVFPLKNGKVEKNRVAEIGIAETPPRTPETFTTGNAPAAPLRRIIDLQPGELVGLRFRLYGSALWRGLETRFPGEAAVLIKPEYLLMAEETSPARDNAPQRVVRIGEGLDPQDPQLSGFTLDAKRRAQIAERGKAAAAAAQRSDKPVPAAP